MKDTQAAHVMGVMWGGMRGHREMRGHRVFRRTDLHWRAALVILV